jgi:hypothetical protein
MDGQWFLNWIQITAVLYNTIHGSAWLCMGVHGYAWQCMAMASGGLDCHTGESSAREEVGEVGANSLSCQDQLEKKETEVLKKDLCEVHNKSRYNVRHL